jgi:hypothetical protein
MNGSVNTQQMLGSAVAVAGADSPKRVAVINDVPRRIVRLMAGFWLG